MKLSPPDIDPLEVVAVVILALGLSACVAAFTYVSSFHQPFPGTEAEGLVRLFGASAEAPYQDLSYPDYLDVVDAGLPFEGLAFRAAASAPPMLVLPLATIFSTNSRAAARLALEAGARSLRRRFTSVAKVTMLKRSPGLSLPRQ